MLALLFLASSLAASNPSDDLRAGVAKIDITPQKPCVLAGYAGRTNLSTGVHDPLSARAVVFEHGGRRLAIISADILGFYNDTAAPLIESITGACGLEPAQLMLSAIHTHAAPSPVLETGKSHPNNIEYTEMLRDRLTAVTKDAISKCRPVRTGYQSGACPVGINRREAFTDKNGVRQIRLGRNPGGQTDPEVQALEICEKDSDRIIAVLFGYATHGTSLGSKNMVVSGDVLGLAAQFVEKYLAGGMIAAPFAGASGDIDPYFRVLPEIKTADNWIAEPVLLGTFLGEEVVHTSAAIRGFNSAGPVRSLMSTLTLPAKASDPKAGNANPKPLDFKITAARVGEVAIVGLGGEVFNGIGRTIKKSSPFAHTIVITHCNGAAGYLVCPEAYAEGGYEVRTTRFSPEAAGMVIKETQSLLARLKEE